MANEKLALEEDSSDRIREEQKNRNTNTRQADIIQITHITSFIPKSSKNGTNSMIYHVPSLDMALKRQIGIQKNKEVAYSLRARERERRYHAQVIVDYHCTHYGHTPAACGKTTSSSEHLQMAVISSS